MYIFQGVLVSLYQENEKLGQSDKRGRNDPGDNDPEKVTKSNMKYGLVLNTAICICYVITTPCNTMTNLDITFILILSYAYSHSVVSLFIFTGHNTMSAFSINILLLAIV